MGKKLLLLWFIVALIPIVSSAQIDYSSEIQPIFDDNCGGCHIGGTTSGVRLDTYDDVMSSVGDQYDKDIVIPEEPDESPLVDKIEPNPTFGDRMPQGGPFLADSTIEKIRQWISEGANQEPTAIADERVLPRNFELLGNYPNPFNPETQIRFRSDVKAGYQINIYNLKGQLVLTIQGTAGVGMNRIPLSMVNRPSGMYLYEVLLEHSDGTVEQGRDKMTLIK